MMARTTCPICVLSNLIGTHSRMMMNLILKTQRNLATPTNLHLLSQCLGRDLQNQDVDFFYGCLVAGVFRTCQTVWKVKVVYGFSA